MGRIEKALQKSRRDHLGESASPDRRKSPVPITDGIDAATYHIDFSKLPVVVPDEECLGK